MSLQAIAKTTKLRIAVIEDHDIVREGIVFMINAQEDMEVVGESNNATDGLRIIQQLQPDIVLTDISMPGVSPFEMVQTAKKGIKNLKCIYLSAHGTDINIDRAMKAGGDGFASKTESMNALMQGIRNVSTGKQYFSSEIAQIMNSDTHRTRQLSSREIEILCLVAKGLTAKKIGEMLKISAKTVERHKSNIMAKLAFHSQVELTRYAIRQGLIDP